MLFPFLSYNIYIYHSMIFHLVLLALCSKTIILMHYNDFPIIKDKVSTLDFSTISITQARFHQEAILYGNSIEENKTCIIQLVYTSPLNITISYEKCFEQNTAPFLTQKSCSIFDDSNNQFDIYQTSETKDGEIKGELWTFKKSTEMWVKQGQGEGPVLQNCSIYISTSLFFISGKRQNTDYLTFYYKPIIQLQDNIDWSEIYLTFQYAFSENVTLWNGQQQETITLYENVPQDNLTWVFSYNTTFRDDILCSHTHSTSMLLISSKIIYILDFQGGALRVGSKLKVPLSSITSCEVVEAKGAEWLFITDAQKFTLYYFNLDYLDSFGEISLQDFRSLNFSYNPLLFSINENIFFYDQNSNFWILEKDCIDQISHLQNSSTIANCFFTKMFCVEGYRGESCLEKQCEGSLRFFDSLTFTEIEFQCSGNGVCSDGTCLCNQYWEGSDCSMYTRKQCYGQLIENWPIMNCECLEETEGGNSCQIVFCYNDCSNHGQCLPSGECLCSSGYIGEDCSIIIIDFPGVFSLHEALKSIQSR